MSIKNKILALTIATTSAMSLGFASMSSSYAAYSEGQIKETIKSALGITYDELLGGCIKDNRPITTLKLTDEQKFMIIYGLINMDVKYDNEDASSCEVIVDGRKVPHEQVKSALKKCENYEQLKNELKK